MIEIFDFSVALNELKQGKKVKRKSWHFDAHLIYFPEIKEAVLLDAFKEKIQVDFDKITLSPYLALINNSEKTFNVWTPRTIDILANDWTVCNINDGVSP